MKTHERKIQNLDASMAQVATAMCEGIPGALNVMLAVITKGSKHDPNCPDVPFAVVGMLDEMGIYGSRLWILYSDVAGAKLGRFLAIIRAFQLGFLKEEEIDASIEAEKATFDVDAVIVRVQERLPKFLLELEEPARG